MTCPSCGASNTPGRKYCVGCGAELRPSAALAPRPEAPPVSAAVGRPRTDGQAFSGKTQARPRLENAGEIKSTAIAALLGLIPGIGQMYVGQYAKGVVMFLSAALMFWAFCLPLAGFSAVLGSEALEFARDFDPLRMARGWIACGFFIALLGCVFSAFDAAMCARRLNNGDMIGPWQFF